MSKQLINWGKASSIAVVACAVGGFIAWVVDKASANTKMEDIIASNAAEVANHEDRIKTLEQWKSDQQFQFYVISNNLFWIRTTLHHLDTNIYQP